MSMRSINGPLTRERYFSICGGEHLQGLFESVKYPQGQDCGLGHGPELAGDHELPGGATDFGIVYDMDEHRPVREV